MKTYKDPLYVLRTKIWTALTPAGKDLETVIGTDESEDSILIAMTNHRTGSTFAVMVNPEDDHRMILRTVIGAAKGAWPHLTQGVRLEDLP
jgi:hypothetical protein